MARKPTSGHARQVANRVLSRLQDEGGRFLLYAAGTPIHSIDSGTGLGWDDASPPICTVSELRSLARTHARLPRKTRRKSSK